MKNRKERKYKRMNFNYIEELKIDKDNPNEDELKYIFNKKLFQYVKRIENRNLRG